MSHTRSAPRGVPPRASTFFEANAAQREFLNLVGQPDLLPHVLPVVAATASGVRTRNLPQNREADRFLLAVRSCRNRISRAAPRGGKDGKDDVMAWRRASIHNAGFLAPDEERAIYRGVIAAHVQVALERHIRTMVANTIRDILEEYAA